MLIIERQPQYIVDGKQNQCPKKFEVFESNSITQREQKRKEAKLTYIVTAISEKATNKGGTKRNYTLELEGFTIG